ncbi:hypothetical protein BIW11_13450 [Tropilaelaps mercedesae]|uniref:Uncharacterized protein n=1 Tax=Tropilaelaps mercedesae TaxID=418985 RepID=A0A1V9X243_9ACAR|nr:hypothetical protein BIW11_13450 [Tropilaelaps mercedesae]
MADKKKSYPRFKSPANVRRNLHKQITQSDARSIGFEEVQQVLKSIQEGSWTKTELVSFFTDSAQKIFKVQNDRLWLNTSSDSSSEGDAEDETKECLQRNTKLPSNPEPSSMEDKGCPECAGIVSKLDTVRTQIEMYKQRIQESEKSLKKQAAIVQELSVFTKPDRILNKVEPAINVGNCSKSSAHSSAISDRIGEQDSIPGNDSTQSCLREKSVNQLFSANPSTTNQEGANGTYTEFRQKEEIFRSVNSFRKIFTRSQIENMVVLPPTQPQKPAISLCSSSSNSSDSESPETDRSTLKRPVAVARKPSSIGAPEHSRRPSVDTFGDAAAEAAKVLQYRHLSLAGFFDRKDQLMEERNGRHDLLKIQSDLKMYTSLSAEEIDAYLTYFRLLQGGNIQNLSSGSVVAAVLAMYEVDNDKEMLKSILNNLQKQV